MRTRDAARQIGVYFNIEILRNRYLRRPIRAGGQIGGGHRLSRYDVAARLIGHVRIWNMAFNHLAFRGLLNLNHRRPRRKRGDLHND